MPVWSGFTPQIRAVTTKAPDVKKRADKKVLDCYEAESWVLQQLQGTELTKLGCNLWLDGVPDLKIDDEVIAEVQSQIDGEFSGQARRWAKNFLVRGLERGRKELNWQLNLPARVVVLRMPTPTVNPESFELLELADILREAWMARWREKPSRVEYGDVLFVAIAFAGITCWNALHNFARHVKNTTRYIDGHVWVEWQITPNGEVWDRVILDSVSSAVVLRWLSEPQEFELIPDKFDKEILLRSMRKVVPLKKAQVTSMTGLLNIFRTDWFISFPPFLAQWSSGKQSSTVLPPHVWFRVLTSQRMMKSKMGVADEEHLALKNYISSSERNEAPSKSPIHELRSILKKRSPPISRSEALRQLKQWHAKQPVDSLNALLADWMCFEIEPNKIGGRGTTISSAYTTLARLDRLLEKLLNGKSPLDVQDQWDPFLADFMEAISERTRKHTGYALRRFHFYLQRFHDFPAIGVDLMDTSNGVVDANLVTETEFALILQRLALLEYDQTKPVLSVAAILGRRLCLRRNEVFGLMLDDVIGISSPVILIRPNLNRDLKTKSSKRVIEWGELCLPAERTLVMDYVRQIRLSADTSEFHRHANLLFPDLEHSFLRISERKLFNPIERVMREVTGDQSLRFHHLRHSAINTYFLAMQEDLVPGTMALLLDQNADQPNMKAWRQTLVGKGESIRPRLWAIAGLAGHATPEITLGSYFHLCDWLRYQYAEAQIKLDDKLIAGLAGITIESLRVIRHREGSESAMLTALIRKRYPSEIYNWQPEACYQPLAEYHEWALQTPAFVDQVDIPWHKGTVQELKVLNEAADLVWPRALVDFAPRFPNSEEDDRKPNKVRSRQFLPEALAIADLSLLARRFGVDPFALKQKLRYVEQLNTQAGLSPLLQSKNQEATPKLAVEVGALQIQRRISLPSVILRRDDEDHATTFDQLLKQLYLEDPEQLDQFIDIFWRCIDLESSIINVGLIDDALVLHNVLHKLEKLSFSSVSFLGNGSRPRIRYQLRTVPNSHLGDADAQLRHWIELLKIQAEHLTFGEEMKKTLKGKECGVLQIYIELMPSLTKSGLAKRQSKPDSTETRRKEKSQALIAAVYIATLQQLLAMNVKPSDM